MNDSRNQRIVRTASLLFAALAFVWCARSWAVGDEADAILVSEPPVTQFDRDYWSFEPISRPDVPEVNDKGWVRNPIDAFLLAAMESDDLAPMPEADRYTLIRRVTFDLTGLPPTPEQIRQFVDDGCSNAYERLVDRLLASDAYGERRSQHWLDLARFAETDGFEHDGFRPNAWRYRDWVINAMNDDVPFDEFVRLQLAGDELKPGDPLAAIATGFLLCGPDMPDINDQQERLHTFLNDMTSTVGSVFLAMQVGCAQCHDHKFDPISQLDFYRLKSFFANADLFQDYPIPSLQESEERKRLAIDRADKWKAAEQEMQEFEESVKARLRGGEGEEDLMLTQVAFLQQLNPKEKREYIALKTRLSKAKTNYALQVPFGRVMRESKAQSEPSYLSVRGDFRRKGPEVTPAYLRIANPSGEPVPTPASGSHTSGRRSALAHWLTDPQNPLTARVAVNRIWQEHFGEGLVATPSDFGLMGDTPTHPELLDWLATEFVRLDWSQKRMHRLMVTSAAYRQASKPSSEFWDEETSARAKANWANSRSKDPDNYKLSRMRRRRLGGEAIRDAMLATGNGLSRRKNGPGIRPPLPQELMSTLLRNQWVVSEDPEDHRRRSVYLFVRRNLHYPIFDLFDKPDTNASCPRRNRSTTAPQALVLFNSELSLSAAREFAGNVWQQSGHDTRDFVTECYLRALGRPPSEDEVRAALAFLAEDSERLRTEHRDASELALPSPSTVSEDAYHAAALTDLCLATFNLNEFVYVD